MNNRKSTKKDTVQIGLNVEAEMKAEITDIASERGQSNAVFIRQAIRSYIDRGIDDGKTVMNLIMLVHILENVKDKLSDEEYAEISGCLENIVKLQGGR